MDSTRTKKFAEVEFVSAANHKRTSMLSCTFLLDREPAFLASKGSPTVLAIAAFPMLSSRHIQNLSEASSLEPHWGYADRAVPCTNDAGSCEYLDSVYRSHDLGMLYMGILYATVGGLLLLWATARWVLPPRQADQSIRSVSDGSSSKGGLQRLKVSVASSVRGHFLTETPLRWLFGRATRLQATILAIIIGYLAIWTFIGIDYRQWVTPVRSSPGLYNTRTGLGPFSDRIGVIAYALTPFSVLLSSRESLLSAVTGIPYQNFNFLHRWLGYIIVAQGSVHTVGWCIVEMRLYQPQPTVGREWIAQTYMIWGVIAMGALLLLFLLSTPWGIRATGYEAFRKAHYALAVFYMGACWAHWEPLRCFLLPGLLLWALDRAARLVRTATLHYNYLPSGSMGFASARAHMALFPDPDGGGDIVRLDFEHPSASSWAVGQHFYLCFPQGSIWQSHPFTPLSLPRSEFASAHSTHSYIFRAKKGETAKIAALARAAGALSLSSNQSLPASPPSPGSRASDSGSVEKAPSAAVVGAAAAATALPASTTPVILSGPYGECTTAYLTPDVNVLCVAGGTGITYVLPVLLWLLRNAPSMAVPPSLGVGEDAEFATPDRKIALIWAVRKRADVEWVAPELAVIRREGRRLGVNVKVFVTREDTKEFKPRSAASFEVLEVGDAAGDVGNEAKSRHPDLKALVGDFVGGTVAGRTSVVASGPGSMLSDLRIAVAGLNAGRKVWKGNQRYDVELQCDDRLEW